MHSFSLSWSAAIGRGPPDWIRKHDSASQRNAGRQVGVARSCGSDDALPRTEKIVLKGEKQDGNTRRAARKVTTTVLQVDRARLRDVDAISHKSARLLPRALLEALEDRIQARGWESALKVFELLRLQEWYDPREDIYVKMLMMLGKCKLPDVAAQLFKTMTVEDKIAPSREAFTALLFAYVNSKRINSAFRLVEHMKKEGGCQLDVYAYSSIIKGCCESGLFDQASLWLSEMWDAGVEPNTVTFNTLVDAFGQVGMLSQMEALVFRMLDSRSCKPDSWTLNIIIKHYGSRGNIEKMEEWFETLRQCGAEPDTVTFNTLIRAYGKSGLHARMKSVVLYMRKYMYVADEITFNSLIETYGTAGLLKEMGWAFSAMKWAGVKFTALTLSRLISVYSKNGMWAEVEKVRRQWKNSDLVPDVPLYNSLLNAYRVAGNLDALEATFSELKDGRLVPDAATYTILIDAFKSRGLQDKAAKLIAELKALDVARLKQAPPQAMTESSSR